LRGIGKKPLTMTSTENPTQPPAPRPTTLADLAALVGGTVHSDPQREITGAAPLGEAVADQITLIDHPDRASALVDSPASAVVCPQGVELGGKPGIVVDQVHDAFAQVVAHFRPRRSPSVIGRHAQAIVDPTAKIDISAAIHAGAMIGADVRVGAGCTIHSGAILMAGCQIGEGTTIFPGAVLYEETRVGQRCLIHANAVLGAYGFGYSQADGRHVLSAQLGTVELGDDVEIGAATTIDRGVYGPTRIGTGTKIDNIAQIAHNCQIGRHNLICSQVGIAGSTTTGDYVVMAGQAGVRDHVTIGAGARLGAKCGISNDVPAGVSVLGVPATAERQQKLRYAAVAKLPEMRKEFKKLRQQVAALEKQLASRDESEPTSAEPTITDRAA